MYRFTHRTYVHGSVLNFIHSYLALLGMFVYVSSLCATLYMFAMSLQIFLSSVSKSFSRLPITAPMKCLQIYKDIASFTCIKLDYVTGSN